MRGGKERRRSGRMSKEGRREEKQVDVMGLGRVISYLENDLFVVVWVSHCTRDWVLGGFSSTVGVFHRFEHGA